MYFEATKNENAEVYLQSNEMHQEVGQQIDFCSQLQASDKKELKKHLVVNILQ